MQLMDENTRLEYLNAMGIQQWQRRFVPLAEAVPEHVPEPARETVPTSVLVQAPTAEWEALSTKVHACELCDLHLSRTQAVFGVGDPCADLLVVGEAPGRDEDLQGEPFVGRAGKLLNNMLLAIGLQREQVYIANILKCRPPNNRDPLASEVACCTPYLRSQIDMIRPRVIFALGRVAAHHLLGIDATLAAMRRNEYMFDNIPLMVSYHPAYLLRKPSEKRKSWEDLQKVRALLQ